MCLTGCVATDTVKVLPLELSPSAMSKTLFKKSPTWLALPLLLISPVMHSGPADARVTRVEIVRVDASAFEGREFGKTGQYEKIVARAHGELDPALPGNALITDINLAPRNARGMVEYSTDVVILKPKDIAKANGRLLYDVVNRGRVLAMDNFNGAPPGNAFATAAHAGSGYLMREGYTVVASGWESDAIIGTAGGALTAKLPVARHVDGARVTGQTIFEYAFDASTSDRFQLVYPAASRDQAQAVLTVRANGKDTRKSVPAHLWSFVDERAVRVERADAFFAGYDAGAAFELIYQAADPVVLGVGYAATRDLISWLRHDNSAANPLRGTIWHTLAHGTSQSGRYLKGFVHGDFNRDEAGQRVFDGINPHISGAHAIALNERFGDANATGRPFHRYSIAKLEFPFTYGVRTDHLTGKTDGLFARCAKSNTCPKVMHTDSGNEAFLKAMNLVSTDGQGRDIDLPPEVRMYFIGSTQHAPARNAEAGVCQQPGNPSDWRPYVRALMAALDAWVATGTPPPVSRYPRVSDGTLVAAEPAAARGFPAIPGSTYNGWYYPVRVFDGSRLPRSAISGKDYVVLVPKSDADGNELGGIRTVDARAPLATYTGWGVRRAGFAEGEDCGLQGQLIPFAATRAERMGKGDPRLSVAERYAGQAAFVETVRKAAAELVRERLLLENDAQSMVEKAKATRIGH